MLLVSCLVVNHPISKHFLQFVQVLIHPLPFYFQLREATLPYLRDLNKQLQWVNSHYNLVRVDDLSRSIAVAIDPGLALVLLVGGEAEEANHEEEEQAEEHYCLHVWAINNQVDNSCRLDLVGTGNLWIL